MWRSSVISLCLVLSTAASVALTGCGKSKEHVGLSLPAPAFATKDLDGEHVSLAELEGTVVLLNVWATWCDPCVHELPTLSALHRQLESKGFTVIGLNVDVRTKLPAVRGMVGRFDLPFPVWLDFGSRAQTVFELKGYPTSFLIDRTGTIRWRREGEIASGDPELTPLLDQLLAE